MAGFKLPVAIFRANDIRGNVKEELTPEVIHIIALGIGSFAQENHIKKLIVARDGRLSSPDLCQVLI